MTELTLNRAIKTRLTMRKQNDLKQKWDGRTNPNPNPSVRS